MINLCSDIARVGDVSLSAEDKPPAIPTFPKSIPSRPAPITENDHDHHEDDFEDDEHHHHSWLDAHSAMRYLLAGGVAGIGKRYQFLSIDTLIQSTQFLGRLRRHLIDSKSSL